MHFWNRIKFVAEAVVPVLNAHLSMRASVRQVTPELMHMRHSSSQNINLTVALMLLHLYWAACGFWPIYYLQISAQDTGAAVSCGAYAACVHACVV